METNERREERLQRRRKQDRFRRERKPIKRDKLVRFVNANLSQHNHQTC